MGGQRARVWVSAGLGRRVKSRVARSIARRVATRDTMRLRRPDPSIVPIERARSIVGGVARARVREPKNADGGGFHASGALEVFASRTRASVPVLAVPDAAAPAGRGSFLRGLLLHRGPALVDHRARLDRARGRREKKVSTRSPIARRARGRRRRRGRVRSRTGSRRRAGEYRGASTERGDVHERAPNAVARANGCAFGRRRHSFFTHSVSGNGTFHSESFVAMSSGRSVPENGKYTQVSSQRFLHVRTLPAVFRAQWRKARVQK